MCAHARLITALHVRGVWILCNKSASKRVARKHNFCLACGALVCASAPIPPPLRYTCHGCSLPHRTSIVLDSALKSHRSEATLATILTCCILLLERSLSEVRVCVRCMLHVACCMLGETLIWGFCHDPCNRFSQVYTHRLCT